MESSCIISRYPTLLLGAQTSYPYYELVCKNGPCNEVSMMISKESISIK